jgi:predicted metal-dependent phosphoesterase TrpH
MRADLHIHTIASDGRWTPEQVVAEVQAREIGLFAIADHDTVASVAPAEKLAREVGLTLLRGVEVSTVLDGRLFHILAYGFDIGHPGLTELLRKNKARLDQQNDNIVHGLIAAGHEIDLDDYVAYTDDPTRGGWKVLNFLIDRSFCTGPRDYFDKLVNPLRLKWPAFPHPADAIAVIRQAGGVPILAHPGISLRRVGVTEETLCPFIDFGIGGLECYSQYHEKGTTRLCLDWCDRHELLITGGSDSHGGFVGRELGVPVVDTADLRLGELAKRYTQ